MDHREYNMNELREKIESEIVEAKDEQELDRLISMWEGPTDE